MPFGWDLSWVCWTRSSCLAKACWLCGHLCVSSAYPLHLPAFGIGVPCHSPSFPLPWAALRALSPLAFKSSHLSVSVLCSSLAFRLPVSVCLSSLPLSLPSFPSGANHPTPTHFGVSWSLLLPPDPFASPLFSFPVVTTKSSSPSHLFPLPLGYYVPSQSLVYPRPPLASVELGFSQTPAPLWEGGHGSTGEAPWMTAEPVHPSELSPRKSHTIA